MDTQKRVLFIADSMAQFRDLEFLIAKGKYPDVTFRYPSKIADEKATIDHLLDDCRDGIKESDVDGIITLHPGNTLIQAVLVKEGDGKFKGPDFQGALMCLHKYYNKQKVLNGFCFDFNKVDMDSHEVKSEFTAALDDIGFPCHLIDAIGSNGSMVRKVRSEKLSMRDIEGIRKLVVSNLNRFKKIIDNNADKDKHPCVVEPLCVVGTYWKDFSNLSFHLAECCVLENEDKVIEWALSDVVYNSGERKSLKYVSMPSVVSDSAEYDIWGHLRIVCSRLFKYGFKHNFFYALVAVSTAGSVKIVDLNCGIIRENTILYRHVLNLGDNLRALMKLSMGDHVRGPKVLPNRFAMRAELRTFNEPPDTIDTCIDVKLAKKMDEIELFVNHGDQVIVPDLEEGGMKLANIYLTGTNKEECLQMMNDICEKIVKPGARMNWKVKHPPKSDDIQQEQTSQILLP